VEVGTPRTEKDHWDRAWEAERPRVLSASDPHLGKNGWFLRALPSLAGKKVVELGGAGSYFLLAFAKWQGADATAVDYSQSGIALTNSIFDANRQPVKTVCQDIFSWHPIEKYDAVLHFGLIEHFEDPTPLLRKCADLLNPDGRLVFAVPNMEALGARLWRRYSPRNWSTHVFHSDDRIRMSCEAVDLRLDRVFFFGWPLLQIAPWESRAAGLVLVSGLQRLTNLASPLYSAGTRSLSCYRGFVATSRRRTIT